MAMNWRRERGEMRQLSVAIVADSKFASMRDSLRAGLRGDGTPQAAVFVLAYHRCEEDAAAALASGACDTVIADLDLHNARCVARSEVPRNAVSVVNGKAKMRREN